jgi:hypothetical protein
MSRRNSTIKRRGRKKGAQKPVRSSRLHQPTQEQDASLRASLSLPVGVAEADPTPADMLLDPADNLLMGADTSDPTSFMSPPANTLPPANDTGSADFSYWNADGAYFAAQAEKYMLLAVEAAEARWDKLEKRILRDILFKTIDGDKP